jgi:hypothetical protein
MLEPMPAYVIDNLPPTQGFRKQDEVTEFMKALTDPAARNLSRLTPQRVPSGLPVDGGGGR